MTKDKTIDLKKNLAKMPKRSWDKMWDNKNWLGNRYEFKESEVLGCLENAQTIALEIIQPEFLGMIKDKTEKKIMESYFEDLSEQIYAVYSYINNHGGVRGYDGVDTTKLLVDDLSGKGYMKNATKVIEELKKKESK